MVRFSAILNIEIIFCAVTLLYNGDVIYIRERTYRIMIEKSFRLSSGFRHSFFPNSNKLFSPQNIPIEIWDVAKRAKESKWNPGVYGIQNITFSNRGDKFVICGGWTNANPNKSEFKIYDTDTLDCIDEFALMGEHCTNPKFTNDDKNFIFGTWKGDVYAYCLDKKSLTVPYSMNGHTFGLIHHGKHNGILYMATTKIANEQSNWAERFILAYNVSENKGSRIDFIGEVNPYEINGKAGCDLAGLAMFNCNLAILTTYYGKAERENDELIKKAKSYVYNIATGKVALIKEDYKIECMFDNYSCIVWSNNGNKLAFIGLHEVYIIDIESNNETIIPFEGATSVEFSNCGMGLAVGGKKAKLFKIE